MRLRFPLFPIAVAFVAGCVDPPEFKHETVPLSEPSELPATMEAGGDLVEVSDARLLFDLDGVPETIGIPLVRYNPFDDKTDGRSKSAICPVRSAFSRTLRDGAERTFFGDAASRPATIRIVPSEIGIFPEESSVRCVFECVAELDAKRLGTFRAEKTSPWPDTTKVPPAVYAIAASIGNSIFSEIAGNRRWKDAIAETRKGDVRAPSASHWTFSDIADNGFSGTVQVDYGGWDMARVQLWVRSKVEQVAMSKLGLKTLENVRILFDGGSENGQPGAGVFRFKVFPYCGFELSYDSATRRGTCFADLSHLGVSAETAYRKAVRFVETVLSDQGVVKTPGRETPPPRYRFDGYRSSNHGTVVEIPFELVN